MTMECIDKSPVINVGQTFVTKFGNVTLNAVYDNSSGKITVTPNKYPSISRSTVDGKVEDFYEGLMTVKTNFFTLAGRGAHFWVCGFVEDKPIMCDQVFRLQDQNGNPLNGNVQIGTTALTVLGTGTISLEQGKSYTAIASFEDYPTQSLTFTTCVDPLTFVFIVVATTGKISCESTPSDALILLGKVISGQPIIHVNQNVRTNLSGPVILSDIDPGEYSVMFTKDGYTSCTAPVAVYKGGVAYAHCTLDPVRTTGALSCTTTPIGTEVYLDGAPESVGVTPLVIEELLPGTHTVIFKLAGYVDCRVQQDVVVGQTRDANCEMSLPPPSEGYIKCRAYDSVTYVELAATIRIDGLTVAPLTPHTTPGLPVGEHSVSFIHEGYVTTTVPVTVVAGETVDAFGSMVEKAVIGIVCSSVPTFASIFLDDENTLQFTPHTLTGISSGIHLITFYKSGYEPTSRLVNASEGQTVNAYAPMFTETAVPVRMRVYIQSSVPEVNEDTFFAFINKVSSFFKSKGLDVNFISHTLEWRESVEDIESYTTAHDVNLVVGEGIGHFAQWNTKVGANLSLPFKFTDTGIMCLSHELGHYFGVIDQYWLRIVDVTTPLISNEIKTSIMYDHYTLSNGFSSFETQIIKDNISKLIRGDKNSILYPEDRWSKTLKIFIGKSNEPCKIFASSRDYSIFKSLLPPTPTLIKSTDSDGFLTIDIKAISGRAEFDIYHIECGEWNIWINSTILDLNYVENGITDVCEARYLNDSQWCELYKEAPVPDGYILCQAYDAATNAELNANVHITPPGASLVDLTPVTTQGLTPGSYDLVFSLDGYADKPITVIVNAGITTPVEVYMVSEAPPVVPGLDITVNIPGLLPNSSLFVNEVVKVPFTDTWWDSPFGPGVRWDAISNGTFKARESAAGCRPMPSFFAGFKKDTDYAIYIGTSAISLYPGKLVHHVSDSTALISIIDSYVDWVSTKICSAFDITPADCSNFIITSVNDAAFLLELWTIITKHENLAGEPTEPTALDYILVPVAIFGMLSPGISEGKVAQEVGKRLTKLVEITKTAPDIIKNILRYDPRIDTFIMRATSKQFDDFVRYMDEGLNINAEKMLKEVDEIPLNENELHALHRGTHLAKAVDDGLVNANSLTPTSTVLSRFSDKLRHIFIRASDFAKDNPKTAVGIGVLAIWFMVDNVPFYIYMYLKSKGLAPGDRSWQGKSHVDAIDQYKFNVIEAQRLGDWDLFCTNLNLWISEVDKFEQYIIANASALQSEGTHGIYVSVIAAYREAISIKQEVHTCALEPLPEVITAKVVDIIDGDTVSIVYGGTEYSCRLLGINTPEGKDTSYLIRRRICPTCEEERWNANKALYDEIKTWANTNMWHKDLVFKSDLSRQFDDYGRLLAVPFDGTVNLCKRELELGYAAVFFYDANKHVNTTEFLASEKIAKDAKIGIWSIAIDAGSIRCVSYPTAAEVWLDGVNTGKKTSSNVYTLENISVGEHTITLKKIIDDISQSCSVTVDVPKDDTVDAECTLSGFVPPPPEGKIHCKTLKPAGTSLSGAKIYLTGEGYEDQYMGDTEKTITTPIGTYSVRYTYPEYEDGTVTDVEVRADQLADATCSMTPSLVPVDKATWTIDVVKNELGETLSAAKVHVDDIYIGHYAPETMTFCEGCNCDAVVSCGFGAHTVTIKKTGYADWVKTRTLVAGDTFTDSPIMLLPSVDKFPVTIESVPGGATIEVDGVQI